MKFPKSLPRHAPFRALFRLLSFCRSRFSFSLIFLLSAGSASAESPYQEILVERARSLNLAHSPEWLKIGHYSRGVLGEKSAIDAPEFFVSPDGKSDPERELEATIRGFFSTEPKGAAQQTIQCAFPARYVGSPGTELEFAL